MTTLQKWPEECNVKFFAGDFANKCEDLELRGREKTLTCRNVIEVRGVQSGMKSGWNKSEDAKETTIECLKTGQNSDYKRRFKQSDVEKKCAKASSWAPWWYSRCQNGRCCIFSLPSGRRGWLFFISLLMRHDVLSKHEKHFSNRRRKRIIKKENALCT